MTQTELFLRFGAALVIGMLIGREREHAFDQPDRELYAGVRTFALIGLLGSAAALASDKAGSAWPMVAVFLLLGALLATAYIMTAKKNGDIGLTTEVSAVVTILAGALCYWGYLALAAAIGVVTALLLSLKPEMHRFAHKITQEDIYTTLKFAIISAIVLPVLPDRSFGPPPLDVLNPYRIWLMVVFISGISFLGYVLMKVIDPRRGIGITGFLGGLVSSTAVTLSFAQRSRDDKTLTRSFALAIIIAWTVMFVRVIIEVAAINWALLQVLWMPLVVAAAVGILYSVILYFSQRKLKPEEISLTNPFELGAAIQFGLLYGVILFVSRAAEIYLGDTGVYFSSIISGVADVDAITLSMAELSSKPDGLALDTASRAIVLAVMSNTCIKEGVILAMGSSGLRWASLPGFVLIVAAGVGVTLLG